MQYIKKKQFEDQDENRQGGIYGGLSYLSPQKSYFSPQVVQQDPNTNQAQQSLVNPVRPPTNTANQNNGIGGNSVDNNFSFSKFTNGRDSVFNPSAIFEKNSGIIRKREDILNDRVKKATEVENIPLAPNRQVEVLTPNQIIMLSSDAAKGDQKAQKRLTDFFNTTKEKGITYDSSKDKGEVATLTNSPIFGSGEEGTNYGLLDYGVSEGLIKGKNERAAEEANKNIQMNADKAAGENKKVNEINEGMDNFEGRRKEERSLLPAVTRAVRLNMANAGVEETSDLLDPNGDVWSSGQKNDTRFFGGTEKDPNAIVPIPTYYNDTGKDNSMHPRGELFEKNYMDVDKGDRLTAKDTSNALKYLLKYYPEYFEKDTTEKDIEDSMSVKTKFWRKKGTGIEPEKEPIDPENDPNIPDAMRRKLRLINDAIMNPPKVRGLGSSTGVSGWAGGTAGRPNWKPYSIEYDPPYGIIDQIIDSVKDRVKSYFPK